MQETEQKESEKKGGGGIKFEAEIMGRKYTSIPAMRRQPWKANKEIDNLEKEVGYRRNLLKKIKDFFVRSDVPVKAEKMPKNEESLTGN